MLGQAMHRAVITPSNLSIDYQALCQQASQVNCCFARPTPINSMFMKGHAPSPSPETGLMYGPEEWEGGGTWGQRAGPSI